MSGQFKFNPFTHKLDIVGTGNTVNGITTINTIGPDGGGNFTVESTNGSITIAPVTNGINLSVTSGTVFVETLTGNTGVATSVANNINVVGSGSITTTGSGATLTASLTGLTIHSVLVGAGTDTITKVGPTATAGQVLQSQGSTTDPAFSTATYPATTTINNILYSSSSNVVGQITTANDGVLITGATGIPSFLANGTTGQVLTATTGSPASWASPATSGTVTSVSVVSANGFAGTVANATTTPAITLTTTQTGLLSGNGTAVTGTAITQYNVLTAGASNAPNSVAPSATSGVPLISQGSSSQPVFGTAVVAGGGTGNTTFTAYSVITAGTTATGAFQNVSGVGTSGQVLTSNGASALPTWQAAAGGSITINGDTGSATGSTITFNANSNSGSSVKFTASGSTVDLNVTDGSSNTLIGSQSGNGSLSGQGNTGLGLGTLLHLTSGSNNTAIGTDVLVTLTSGSQNTVIGSGAMQSPNTGSNNIAIGYLAAQAYSGAESSNIIIGNTGVISESNVIRIGTQGSGTGQQNKCFIAGIEGVSVSNTNMVTINTATGQLGSQAISGALSLNVQNFVSAGSFTYTPTSGMLYCVVECIGGGGGGIGATCSASTTVNVGGGGGSGAYCRKVFTAAAIGASKALVVGAGAAAGSTGGNTTFGALITCIGGQSGLSGVEGTFCTAPSQYGNNSSSSGGDINGIGAYPNAGSGYSTAIDGFAVSGGGGSSIYGCGGYPVVITTSGSQNGIDGAIYGAGGGGGAVLNMATSASGGSGADGAIFITEYI